MGFKYCLTTFSTPEENGSWWLRSLPASLPCSPAQISHCRAWLTVWHWVTELTVTPQFQYQEICFPLHPLHLSELPRKKGTPQPQMLVAMSSSGQSHIDPLLIIQLKSVVTIQSRLPS